jgi:WD40 repeat protein
VTSVAYNPFHDQLLASGSSDGRVDLWRVSSISSAPLLELGEEEEGGNGNGGSGAGDGAGASGGQEGGGDAPTPRRRAEPKLAADAAIRVHDVDHEDSVVGVAWSARTAWVYASLSYTGRLAVAQVPSAEKYKILL